MRWIDAKGSEVANELELASNKMEQVQYNRIVSYLRTDSSHSSMTKNEIDSLRRKALWLKMNCHSTASKTA